MYRMRPNSQVHLCKCMTSCRRKQNDNIWVSQNRMTYYPSNSVAKHLLTEVTVSGLSCCCCQVTSVVSDSVWPHRWQPTRLPPSLGFSRQEHWSGLPFPSPMQESGKWKWRCSVVSDSQRPHGLQPTRLLHPWDTALKVRRPRLTSWFCNRDIKHHISLHRISVPCA